MGAKRINDWGLEDRLGRADRPLVAFFLASGIRRLEIPKEEFLRLASSYPEAEFVLIDLLENPSLARRFRITSIPTTVIFVGGLEMTRHLGKSLEQPVERILGPRSDRGEAEEEADFDE